VTIEDPAAVVSPEELAAALADESERLVALGGDLTITTDSGTPESAGSGSVQVCVRLPDRLEPVVDSSVGAELRTTP
jgi:hypothetical protein